jgi:hypothetical protein
MPVWPQNRRNGVDLTGQTAPGIVGLLECRTNMSVGRRGGRQVERIDGASPQALSAAELQVSLRVRHLRGTYR